MYGGQGCAAGGEALGRGGPRGSNLTRLEEWSHAARYGCAIPCPRISNRSSECGLRW